ncbi:MAG: LLM class flavin-dependent oxidoreductase [Actinomycetota bacterium]
MEPRTTRARSTLKLGAVLPAHECAAVDLARAAERLGVDSVWVPDRFSRDHAELFTTAAAVAGATERVEVGAYMLNASLRDPAMLTKSIASLDRLAPARIRIILGTGWDRSDYEALGLEFPSRDERGRRTRQALAVIKTDTRVPVTVAGVSDDVLRLAAAEADGWFLSADAIDTYFERAAFLRRACAEAGRSFDGLRVSCTLPCIEDAEDRIADLGEHGMDEFLVVLDADDVRGRLEPILGTRDGKKEGTR